MRVTLNVSASNKLCAKLHSRFGFATRPVHIRRSPLKSGGGVGVRTDARRLTLRVPANIVFLVLLMGVTKTKTEDLRPKKRKETAITFPNIEARQYASYFPFSPPS